MLLDTAASTASPTAATSRIRAVFDAQRQTALRLRTSSAKERVAKIKRLRDAVLDTREIWYRAGASDFRKPEAEVDLAEILPVVAQANDAMRNLARWMAPKRVSATPLMLGTSGYLQYEPRGRCLVISPWNYPLNLTMSPLVSAIAAGNTAILKPSEMTPAFSAAMAKLVKDLFPEDEIALFEGDAAVSTALLELPFDHIFFTGSPAIGKVVMTAAAKHLASVTLELGGKSPTIVDATADLDLAAQNVLWGKFANDGQTCIAPDHVFVHAAVKEAFLERCRAVLDKAYGKDAASRHASPHLARIVNLRHTARVKALLDDAVARGAKAVTGGDVVEGERYIAPTLLVDVPADARIMQEEIFGPLLPILAFQDLGEVIGRINAEPKPLALYVFSRNEKNIERVMKETTSGGACINHTLMQYLHGNLPFGGVNNSGIGSAHGQFGFKSFSHERAVVRTVVSSAATLFAPGEIPAQIRNALRKMTRWL